MNREKAKILTSVTAIGMTQIHTVSSVDQTRHFRTTANLWEGTYREQIVDLTDGVIHWDHSFTRAEHSVLSRSKLHRLDVYQFLSDPNKPLLPYERWGTPPHGKDHRQYWILTRDPNMNRAFIGSEMVCEPYPAGHQQDTALAGFQCVVTPAEQRHLLIENYKDWIQT